MKSTKTGGHPVPLDHCAKNKCLGHNGAPRLTKLSEDESSPSPASPAHSEASVCIRATLRI